MNIKQRILGIKYSLLIITILIFMVSCQLRQETMDVFDITSDEEIIDITSIKKIPIEDPILDDEKYCNFESTSKYCICQKNYVKVVNAGAECVSKLCTLVEGHIEESGGKDIVLFPNYLVCSGALFTKDYLDCQLINYELGQDICILNLVSNTNNLSLCQFIKNDTLKEECLV